MVSSGSASSEPAEAGEPDVFAEGRVVESMPGRLALAKIATVARINSILRGNIAELSALIAKMKNPAFSLPILDARQPESHDAFLGECERLLHNALSAVQSRVDLLRTFVSRYVRRSTPSLADEYESRIATDFATDPLHLFLKDLRNYMLHERLPVAVGTYSFGKDGEDYVLSLSTPPLAASDRFSVQARAWMTGQGEHLDVVTALHAYYGRVAQFDRWFAQKIEDTHRAEIEAYRHAAKAYNDRWYSNF